jgi:hypothetical protein
MKKIVISKFPTVLVTRLSIKSGEAGQICGRILADFYRKGQKVAKLLTILPSSSYNLKILVSRRNILLFPKSKTKIVSVIKHRCLYKKVKITRGTEFFPPNWSESFVKSWQHWLVHSYSTSHSYSTLRPVLCLEVQTWGAG